MPSEFSPSVDSRNAYDLAREKDCTVLLADDHTLQVDIDSDDRYAQFLSQLERMRLFIDVDYYEELKSRSGNRHVLVKTTKPHRVRDRILLQACLGSDPVRELLSYRRVVQGDPHPVLLLRPNPKLLTTGHEPKALLEATPEVKRLLNEIMEND